MFVTIGTGDLDFKCCNLGAGGHFDPRIARQLNRIYRIGDYGATNSQVILGDGIGDTVPCIVERLAHDTGNPDGFFYRIDTQVHCADLASQLARDGGLANAGQSAKDNQHSYAAFQVKRVPAFNGQCQPAATHPRQGQVYEPSLACAPHSGNAACDPHAIRSGRREWVADRCVLADI